MLYFYFLVLKNSKMKFSGVFSVDYAAENRI